MKDEGGRVRAEGRDDGIGGSDDSIVFGGQRDQADSALAEARGVVSDPLLRLIVLGTPGEVGSDWASREFTE